MYRYLVSIMPKSLLGRMQPYNGIKTTAILQQTETECGLTALAILFSYYKFNIPLEKLRDQCGISRDGTKALTLIKIAQRYGFQAEAFCMDIDAICLLQEPVIAFWNFNHFVVINGVGRSKIFINDPGHGNHVISYAEFDKCFTGIVIRLVPTEQVQCIKKTYHYQILLRKWFVLFYKEIIFILMCSLLLASFPLLNTTLINVVIDQYQYVVGSLMWLNYIIFLSAVICFLYFKTMLLTKWVEFKLTVKASLLKASQTILHLLQMPLMYFALRQKSEIIAIISQVDHVMDSMHRCITSVLGRSVMLSMMLIFMCKANLKLCYISVCASLLCSFILIILNKVKINYEKANLNLFGKHYANSLSWIRNLETIHACALRQTVLTKWQSLLAKKLQVSHQINLINSWLTLILIACNQTTNLLVLFIGGLDVMLGVYSIGNLMAYCAVNTFFNSTMIALFESGKNWASAYTHYCRIDDLSKNAIDQRYLGERCIPKKYSQQKNHPIIACHNINFFYNKTVEPVIKNLSLNINHGEHIGIVGGTGSGKSTLVKLMCALYQPDNGTILSDGQNLANYTTTQLSQIFAYVSQDVNLLTGTIYDNLTIGNEHADMRIINKAIQIACIEDLINLRGLYLRIEEQGYNLSGGEKQRLDIARALIQDTPILILDEATSALDTATEQKLIRNLRMTAKTIIFVAHRLTTVKHCDKIIVLNRGNIHAIGQHSELLKNNSQYARLAHLDDNVLGSSYV